jgi:hypothetical protein
MVIPENGRLPLRERVTQQLDDSKRCGKVWLRRSMVLVLIALAGLTGCTGSKPGESAKVPASAGDVWEVDRAAERSAMPGAMVAYANGLHVMVMDGKDIYAGMIYLKAESGPNGARVIKLPSGLEAQLVPMNDGRMELKFSSGESVPLRKK